LFGDRLNQLDVRFGKTVRVSWRRIQVLPHAADWVDMTVSSSSSPAAAAMERVMIVLKKEQDVARTEGQALLSLIDQARPWVGGQVSVYA
jgi:hypothetical protein